jgi:hypothetical protein
MGGQDAAREEGGEESAGGRGNTAGNDSTRGTNQSDLKHDGKGPRGPHQRSSLHVARQARLAS